MKQKNDLKVFSCFILFRSIGTSCLLSRGYIKIMLHFISLSHTRMKQNTLKALVVSYLIHAAFFAKHNSLSSRRKRMVIY